VDFSHGFEDEKLSLFHCYILENAGYVDRSTLIRENINLAHVAAASGVHNRLYREGLEGGSLRELTKGAHDRRRREARQAEGARVPEATLSHA